MTDQVQQVPVLRFSLQHQVSEDRALVLETYVPNDAPLAEINSMLDKVSTASTRQFAKLALPGKRKKLEYLEKTYQRALEDRFRIDEEIRLNHEMGGRRNPKDSEKDRVDREQAGIKIERWREDALQLRDEIAELEALIKDE